MKEVRQYEIYEMSASSVKNCIREGKGLDLRAVPAVLINFVEYPPPSSPPSGGVVYTKKSTSLSFVSSCTGKVCVMVKCKNLIVMAYCIRNLFFGSRGI